MSIKKFLKTKPGLYTFFFNLLKTINYFTFRFHYSYKHVKVNDRWTYRIGLVATCPDNKKIPRVADAGKVYKKYQVMHNGLKIYLGSYYSVENAYLLEMNKGVHEPQEEYVFKEVLNLMPEGATMMELGSYWAFYSMWFASQVPDYKCYMIEPDPHKLLLGKWNFKLNGMNGTFRNGFIGSNSYPAGDSQILSIDELMKEYNIGFLDILHSDIQGFEYEMLQGAKEALNANKIGFVFISTHSNELHHKCIKKLEEHKFEIICDADLDESYSWDGLIVARSSLYKANLEINVSKRASQ